MEDTKTLKFLFTALHGSLPYEYDVVRVNGEGLEDTITISKTNAEHVIYITANMSNDNDIFDINLYDDPYDDDPAETTQWDADDPTLNLIDLIAYIKKSL